jgi:hypothetical protein
VVTSFRSPGTVAAALTTLGLTAGLAIGPAVLAPLAAEPAGATTAAGAQANDPVAEAAAALGADPVYVDPAAEQALDDDEAADLRNAIRESGTPVFVAVLPASAGEPEDVVRRLVADVGLSGTYAGIVGDTFRATSTQLASADEIASAAFQAERDAGPAAVLERFVEDLGSSAAGGGTGGSGALDDGRGGAGDDGGGASDLLPAGLLVAGGAGALVWSRRRRNQRATEQRSRLAKETQMLRAELSVVGDDVLRLEPEVDLHPDARNDYEAAVERHRIASAALDYADEAVDLVRVQRVVDEARYAMARARAIIRGHEPPPPPDELRQPGRHQEPPLDLDERGVPVYAGGQPFYGSGGWFGGGMGAGAGLFGGLLLGSMLGGPFGWGGGWGWGGPVIMGGGWGDGGDGGDGGGDGGGWGDGGGFDMGGGDWGGGDMGGGDF